MEDAIGLVEALDGTQRGGTRPLNAVDAALAAYESERAGLCRQDPGLGPPFAVVVGAFRPVLPEPAAVAVRLRISSAARFPESKLRQRDAAFVDSVHRAWSAAHGGAEDPLHTPIDIAGTTQPGRVVAVAGGAARLASGPLPLRPGPGRWGAWISAPDTKAGLDQAVAEAARGLAAGAVPGRRGGRRPADPPAGLRGRPAGPRRDHAPGRGRNRGQCLRGPGTHGSHVRPRRSRRDPT